MIEATYVMIKPNIAKLEASLKDPIVKDIISRYNACGLDVIAMKKARLTLEQAEVHYDHLKDEDFFEELTNFMADEVIEMIVIGENAVEVVRKINGPTNVLKARKESPNSIRALYGDPNFACANAIHASDSKENAEIEINRFFPELHFKQPKFLNVPEAQRGLVKHKYLANKSM